MGCSEKLYAIREVSELTGVKPVTLRAWQRRYNLVQPQRTEKGHRLYTDQDIALIKLIQSWLSKGVSIGKVKGLLEANMAPSGVGSEQSDYLEEVEPLLNALASLRRSKAESVINTVLKEYPLEVVESQFISPILSALESIKRAQRILQISLFTSLIVAKLESIIESENKAAKSGKCLLINCGDSRDIASRLWAAHLSDKSWNVTLMDNVEDVSGLVDINLADNYQALAIYSEKPLTEQQKSAIRQVQENFDGECFLSDVLNVTQD